jgi:GxxExxY protein
LGHDTKGPGDNDRAPLLEEELTGKIIAGFYETYRVLGYGFLESVYRKALAIELRSRGLRVQEEVPIEVFFKGINVGRFRLDLLVEGRVGVEIKASATLGPTDKDQTLNYLTSTTVDVGLLLHFGPSPKLYRFVSPRVLE